MVYLLVPLFLTASPAPAASAPAIWWASGHRVVAEVAWLRLTPEVRNRVTGLLEGQSFADASTWADSIRPKRRETAPFHYVNIPTWAIRFEPREHCPDDACVIRAVERFRRVLADRAASPADRTEALRFLVHLVGDMHQPLHVGDQADRGGNDRHLILNGRETNLHSVWDGEVVRVLAPSEATLLQRVASRVAAASDAEVAGWNRGTVTEWAMEGHAIARDRGYRLPPDGNIGREYLEAQSEVVETQLAKAAVRLAFVLTEALGDEGGNRTR